MTLKLKIKNKGSFVDSLLNQLEKYGLSRQLIKFCIVGFTGVFVNLLSLKLLIGLGMVSTLASALSIQISIFSNFLIHDAWTFQAQKESQGFGQRIVSFELVSLVGAMIQWSFFITMNLCWLKLGFGEESWEAYFSSKGDFHWRLLFSQPPRIGVYIYISQLIGIVAATGWNFLANLKFTWKKQ